MNTLVGDLKRWIPSFDLYKLHEVRSLRLDFVPRGDRQVVNVLMSTRYVDGDERYRIRIKLCDVRQLRLPELGTAWFELSEVEISPIDDRMMEGLRYHFEDYGGHGMSCDCHEIQISVRAEVVLNGKADAPPSTGPSS